MNCFNLVIERLLISGQSRVVIAMSAFQFQSRYRAASHFRSDRRARGYPRLRFNLVIERLLISGTSTING